MHIKWDKLPNKPKLFIAFLLAPDADLLISLVCVPQTHTRTCACHVCIR